MRLTIDREADALYIRLDDSKIVESEEVSHGVVLDYSENDEVVGVEILWLSKRSPALTTLLCTTRRCQRRRSDATSAWYSDSVIGGPTNPGQARSRTTLGGMPSSTSRRNG